MASLVLRGRVWYVVWRFRGRQFWRSTGAAHDGKTQNGKPRPTAPAKRELRRLESSLERGRNDTRTTLAELFDMVEDHYAVAGFRSAAQLRSRLKHLRPFFGRTEARHVSRADLLAYSRRRKEEGARAATINRELEVVGRAFRMGRQAGQTENPLTIEKLREAPPRQGFFDAGEVAALLARLPDYLRAPVEFAWLTGWRRGEVFGLEWRQVDFGAGEIRLGTSKTDRPRVFPITPRIGELLESVKPEDGTIRALVFTRYGRPVADFRKAWATACAAIGKPGTLFHDLRRSAARRMEADGVPRSVIMALMGHSTEAMFHRYRIVSQADLRTVSNLLANRR